MTLIVHGNVTADFSGLDRRLVVSFDLLFTSQMNEIFISQALELCNALPVHVFQ